MDIMKLVGSRKALLSDGAWGTEIARYGFDPGSCSELLNVDNPEVITGVARSYVDAGSDIILTNTFQGCVLKLKRFGLGDRTRELSREGALLSRKAAGNNVFVCGSLGPSGEFLRPVGMTQEKEMVDSFAEQVLGFVEGGVDAVLVETMSDLGETLCALKAARENSDLPVICSMTFEKGQKGYATMMGVLPDAAAEKLSEAGADIIGANCGAGIDQMIEIAPIMRKVSEKALWFKANAGLPELIDGRTVFRETPEYMASRVPDLLALGAGIIGGCCGTTPDHIRAIRDLLQSLSSKSQA